MGHPFTLDLLVTLMPFRVSISVPRKVEEVTGAGKDLYEQIV